MKGRRFSPGFHRQGPFWANTFPRAKTSFSWPSLCHHQTLSFRPSTELSAPSSFGEQVLCRPPCTTSFPRLFDLTQSLSRLFAHPPPFRVSLGHDGGTTAFSFLSGRVPTFFLFLIASLAVPYCARRPFCFSSPVFVGAKFSSWRGQ